MTRAGTFLVALLAVLALAAAAGSFTAADQPTLSGVDEPATGGGQSGATAGAGDAQAPPGGEGGGEQVGDGPSGPADATESGGISPLFVALFVGAIIASAVLAVLLTGDDDRAPRPDDAADERGDPRPDVEVRYGSPGTNAVIRAWERLTEAVDSTAADTPGETAERAVDRGFPTDAVAGLRENFLAVRYGGEPVDGREGEVRDALDSLDRRRDATTDRGDES